MAPHQRAATVRHRQHCQRTILREAFKRSPVVRYRGRDVGNYRQLLIRLLQPVNTAGGSQCGARTVGGHQQATINHFAIFQRNFYALLRARHAGYAIGAVQCDARCFAQQRKQTQPDVVQFYHLAQSRNTVFLRIQRHKSGMTAIADVNRFNGRCAIGNRLPYANSRQLLAGSCRQSDRPGIKPGMAVSFRFARFYQMNRQSPMAELRNGQRQRRANHTTTNDNHAHCSRAAAINASMSSAFFTTLAVRFSLPSSVMRMSSSIRMPIPR